MKICQNIKKSWDFPRNHEKPSVFENHEIFTSARNHEKPSKSLKIMRFSHCPEIMKNRQSVLKSWKRWDFHITQKSWKTVKKFEILRFSHCPEIMKNRQSVWKSWDFPRNHEKLSKVFKNHEIFTLPGNHEKPSKCLKIIKAMRFSHCPEIMKNCQKYFHFVWKSWKTVSVWKSWDFHIAQKSWKTVKVFKNHESNEIFTLP